MRYLILSLILLAGCEARIDIEQKSQSINEQNHLRKIVEVDGYTVYRFYDGSFHYFIAPQNGQAAILEEKE
jgi:hypothetical protein